MADSLVFDFTRPPNSREAVALRRRLSRLEAARASTATSTRLLSVLAAGRTAEDSVRFRRGYAALATPASPGGSGRVLPARADRPPVTRLMSPRGAALRLHMVAIADAQFRGRAGRATKNERPLRPGHADQTGWSDLLASEATMKGDGAVFMTAQDKRVRQLHSALDALKAAGLVELPHQARGAGKYEGFQLLEETATRSADEDSVPYRVPVKGESTFSLPDAFVTRGWVHVLADTEIALLCMVACGLYSVDTSAVAVPAFYRVQHYGIGRDAFEAHHWLSRFGLLEVTEVRRHDDGRSEDFEEDGALLHRLQLLRDGFEADAMTVVQGAIRGQLARVKA